MMRPNPTVIHHRAWNILPFAVPQPNGSWAANCDIEKKEGEDICSYHSILQTVVRDRKEDALKTACDNARYVIDCIIADPLI